MTSRTAPADTVMQSFGSIASNSRCPVIAQGKSDSSWNGTKSMRSSSAREGRHRRQRLVAVDGGATVAGDVLDDGHHALGQQALGSRAASAATGSGRSA